MLIDLTTETSIPGGRVCRMLGISMKQLSRYRLTGVIGADGQRHYLEFFRPGGPSGHFRTTVEAVNRFLAATGRTAASIATTGVQDATEERHRKTERQLVAMGARSEG